MRLLRNRSGLSHLLRTLFKTRLSEGKLDNKETQNSPGDQTTRKRRVLTQQRGEGEGAGLCDMIFLCSVTLPTRSLKSPRWL
jgi:hypothetical protein